MPGGITAVSAGFFFFRLNNQKIPPTTAPIAPPTKASLSILGIPSPDADDGDDDCRKV
jgi:hypothetical protein